MNIQQALNHITKNIHLTQAQMEDVMRSIMQGEATEAQIGALMMGLRMKAKVSMRLLLRRVSCVI